MIRSHLLDVYGVRLHVVTSRQEWKLLRAQFPKLDRKPTGVGMSHFLTVKGDPHVALWVNRKAHKAIPGLVNTCAHEAAHAAGQIMEFVHADPDPSGEPHAYLVGWITQWLWEAVCPSLV